MSHQLGRPTIFIIIGCCQAALNDRWNALFYYFMRQSPNEFPRLPR